MKTWWLSLCVGWLLAAAAPCRAQTPAGEAAPLMLVYLAKVDDNALPRIALGLEKPVLKIAAFAKCVRISTANENLGQIAAQLTPEDTRTLVAAIKALGAPDAHELPNVVIWFASPDNKVLDSVSTSGSNIEPNLVKDGVFMFGPQNELPVVRYLTEKLHPE